MDTQDDKSKRLKEIQDRLAEIQAGSKTSTPIVKKPDPPKEENADSKPKVDDKKESLDEKNVKPSQTARKVVPPPTIKKVPAPEKAVKVSSEKNLAGNKDENAKSWKENKMLSDDKSQNSGIKKSISSEEKLKSNIISKIFTIISLLITVAIISYLAVSYFNNGSNEEKDLISSQIPEDKESSVPIEESISEEIEMNEDVANSAMVEEITEEIPSEESNTDIPEEVASEKKIPTKTSTREVKKNNSQSISGVIPSGFIISYASNSEKTTAVNNVSQLRAKGFQANYYYMPDKNANGPALYKVYIGPYNNESAALPDFKKVVSINDNAFILNLN